VFCKGVDHVEVSDVRSRSTYSVRGPMGRRPVMGDSAICYGMGGRSVEWWEELLEGVGSGTCVVCEGACA
jgi:hypothetical protein